MVVLASLLIDLGLAEGIETIKLGLTFSSFLYDSSVHSHHHPAHAARKKEET